MSKFAIIGSNSFSGSNFVKHLCKQGHEVLGISRSPELHKVFLAYKGYDGGKFSFLQLDLNQNLDESISTLGISGRIMLSILQPKGWLPKVGKLLGIGSRLMQLQL